MASIFDFLTGGSPNPAWSYLGYEGVINTLAVQSAAI